MNRSFLLNHQSASVAGVSAAGDAGIVLPPGSRQIGVGLVILGAAMFWPGVPAVTGLALAALGATDATIARFRSRDGLLLILLLHTAVYGGLYIIFVGAALNGYGSQHATVLKFVSLADIALSVVPVGLALVRMWHELGGSPVSE